MSCDLGLKRGGGFHSIFYRAFLTPFYNAPFLRGVVQQFLLSRLKIKWMSSSGSSQFETVYH